MAAAGEATQVGTQYETRERLDSTAVRSGSRWLPVSLQVLDVMTTEEAPAKREIVVNKTLCTQVDLLPGSENIEQCS